VTDYEVERADSQEWARGLFEQMREKAKRQELVECTCDRSTMGLKNRGRDEPEVHVPTGGCNKCLFSSIHLGKLIGSGNMLVDLSSII
jgi:hypothetical protein